MARDLPLSTAGDAPTTSSTRSGSASSAKMSLPTISIGPNITVGGGPNDPPMIAGQLLIYDLDETPPDELINEGEVGGKRSLSGGSVSTRRALPSDDGAADGLFYFLTSFRREFNRFAGYFAKSVLSTIFHYFCNILDECSLI